MNKCLCVYCGGSVPPERWGLGYHYCMKRICIETGGMARREDYRLMLMPKQGFAIVHKDSPDLKDGKSSGRT